MEKLEKICFRPEGASETVEFFVLEQTRFYGSDYILVTEQEQGDGEALILKDIASEESAESIYEIVSDEQELTALAGIFEELLEDVELEQ